MSLVNFTNTLAFDNVAKSITFTDTSDYSSYPAAVITAQVTDPLGNNYAQVLTLPTNSFVFNPVLDTDGEMIRGVYVIEVSAVEAAVDLGSATSNINFSYESPEIDIDLTVDCITPSLTSTDNTNYTVNGQSPSSITYAHTLQYPPSTGEADIVSTNPEIVTGTVYTIKGEGLQHSATMVTDLTYDFTSWSVTDQVTGTGYADVYCDNDLCDVYCCIRSKWQEWQTAKCESKTLADKASKDLYDMIANSYLLRNAMECGKADDISSYTEQILKIGNCSGDCGCDSGEPMLITGLGGVVSGGAGATAAVVSGGLPIIVTSNTVGTLTTYTVSFDPTYNATNVALLDTLGNFTGSSVEDALLQLFNDLTALTTTVGVAAGDTDLGTFTGSTISDNVDLLTALQEIETALEGATSGVTNLTNTASATEVTIESSSGTNTSIAGATTSLAGVVSAADQQKLDNLGVTSYTNVNFLRDNVKKNVDRAVDPTVNDDAGAGFLVNSLWTNRVTDMSWICSSSSLGGAIWTPIGQGGAGSGTDLSFAPTPTEGQLSSSTGLGTVIPLATVTDAGLMPPDDKFKSGKIAVTNPVDLDVIASNSTQKNLNAVAAPNITDDSSSGWEVGSTWWDTNNNKVYGLLDDTIGNAIWIDLSAVGGGGGVTNLSYNASPTNGVVVSDTGTDATILLADSTNAGLMDPDQNDKVNLLSVTGSIDLDFVGSNVVKNNYTASVAPGVNDDDGDGYEVGSFWHNPTGVKSYVCLSSATGAAVWIEITSSGAGATNIGYTPSPTDGTITSSTGTSGTVTLADTTNAGLMSPADFDKVDFLTVTGAADVDFLVANTQLKNNAASAAPTVTDDSASGYAVGSQWNDTTANESYVCLDASVGAAVWKTTTAAGGAAPVDSVNGQTGVVVLDADDIDDTSTTNKFATAAELGLIASATQPGDNVSTLTNDAGYITTDTNLANTDLTLTGTRTHDLDGNRLNFDIGASGRFAINNLISTGTFNVTSNETNGIIFNGSSATSMLNVSNSSAGASLFLTNSGGGYAIQATSGDFYLTSGTAGFGENRDAFYRIRATAPASAGFAAGIRASSNSTTAADNYAFYGVNTSTQARSGVYFASASNGTNPMAFVGENGNNYFNSTNSAGLGHSRTAIGLAKATAINAQLVVEANDASIDLVDFRNSSSTSRFNIADSGEITFTTIQMHYGTGTPEGVVTAPAGSFYLNDAGGAGTTLYIKESGAGNTGWIAK